MRGRKKSRMIPAVVPENSDVKGCHRDGKDMESSCFREREEDPGVLIGLARFEVPTGNPRGNVYQAIGRMILELRTEVEDVNLRVINKYG